MSVNAGTRLGPYEIHSAIGAGGMGDVYRARDTRLDRLAAKRGAGAPRLALDPELAPAQKPGIDLVALDDALGKLAALDSQQGRLIELRFFGGLSIEEAAVVLSVSPATVKREWVTARAWLRRELKRNEGM
jgi:DNA-directed RNA polymerase specialized sigma24 family protein